MTSLKNLAMYCRDYIDLVSPSLLSRQAKQVVIPQHILDATPLYKKSDEVDYESLSLSLNLEPKIEDLSLESEEQPDESSDEQDEEEKLKLEIAKSLDEIYRKYETSSYTKQVSLKFGRVSFSAKPLIDNGGETDEEDLDWPYKKVEQHLFSVPITISYRDFGGSRHYSLIIDDTLINTNVSFLNEFLPQEDRDELFKFIAEGESAEDTAIPLKPSYVDELWTKITHYLRGVEAKDWTEVPDMENTLVILLPKVNYFLSQDLMGIIDAADDEEMLETSLSAWVDDQEMSVNEPTDDSGSQELFFPFPYDGSQLQVLGKLGNRAAVVEGPPGTGKSQTIANILCHLAATGKKVLFVSQKDQAVRGVKDKLKTLDIPYLFGYLPDRSSRLHSEEDERDSAANALKGIAQAFYTPTSAEDPAEALSRLNDIKPIFEESIEESRKYFELYNECGALDEYEFGSNTTRISPEWLHSIDQLKANVVKNKEKLIALEQKKDKTEAKKASVEKSLADNDEAYNALTTAFAKQSGYDWVLNEKELLRGINYADVALMMMDVMDRFETHVSDRKSNFIKSKLNNIKLSKELDKSIEALPREMYESIKGIVFSDTTKTQRYLKLKEIYKYFTDKEKYEEQYASLKDDLKELTKLLNTIHKEAENTALQVKQDGSQITKLSLDDISMERVRRLADKEGSKAFELIKRRHELVGILDEYDIMKPNEINEFIMREKAAYKSLIRNYLKNRLAHKVEGYRQEKQYRAALESIGRKLSKTKKAYKTFDSLKSNPFNFEAMSGIIPIWMMGLDDASRVLPLANNIFDYVIIDEASQCNISYALPVMYRSRHTILFGDTLQMRDTTTAFKSNERLQALANKHSIPEDLQIKASEDSVKSVMDIAKLSGFQTSVLRNHYRSPMELIGFSNEWFYEPRGRRLQVINDDILAMEDGRVLKNHVIAADPSIELSDKTNLSEAVYIRDNLLKEIQSNPQTKDKSIAILTFFNEQAELLRRVITDDSIKIAVIEGIQGDERDIVIYSFVIKSPEEKRRYTALTGESGEISKEVNEGRVNVAFSRARLQVHTVTSIPPNLWPDGIWIKRYLEYVETKGRVNRIARSEQHFDSKFEEHIYDFLFNALDTDKYTLTTQVESCGFKLDLVVRNIKTGKKLAIECDGPTHFEAGDGQVRVQNDYERQSVLETAGWRFYRISFVDWQEDQKNEKESILKFIKDYMKTSEIQDSEIQAKEEFVYVPEVVEVNKEWAESLKNTMKTSSGAFGRRTEAKSAPKATSKIEDKPQLELTYVPDVQPKATTNAEPTYVPIAQDQVHNNPPTVAQKPAAKEKKPKVVVSKGGEGFRELTELSLSPRRSLVISSKTDGSLWINEKLNTDNFKGFTSKGFGIHVEELSSFLEALDGAIAGSSFEKDFVISDSLKLVVHNPDADTVDVRYYKTSDGYTGYLKKGIRVIKPTALKLKEELEGILAKN